MFFMTNESNKINFGQLSVIMATILLAYSLTPFITIPNREINLQLFGFIFIFRVDYTGLVSILAAGLGATGMSWLLQSRHGDEEKGYELQHFLLPALTAWAIGVPLGALEINLQWWVVFLFGGLLLGAVFYSEYIVVDLDDIRSPLAVIGLTSVGYAIYFILSVAFRGAGMRLYLFLPVILFSAGLITWRILKLRFAQETHIHWTIAAGLITTQTAVGLHYLPINPIQFGLILTGFMYAGNSLAIQNMNKSTPRRIILEQIIFFTLFLALTFLTRS
jgi:hypothetical protein